MFTSNSGWPTGRRAALPGEEYHWKSNVLKTIRLAGWPNDRVTMVEWIIKKHDFFINLDHAGTKETWPNGNNSWVVHEWLMSGSWVDNEWVMIDSWTACLSRKHMFKSTAWGTRNQVGIVFAQPSWVCNKNSSWVSAVSLFMSGQWKKHSERRSGEKMFMSGCSFVKHFHE